MTATTPDYAALLRVVVEEDQGDPFTWIEPTPDSRDRQNTPEAGPEGVKERSAALRRGTPASRAGAAARQGAASVVTRWWHWAVVTGAVVAVIGAVGWWVG